MEDQPVPPAAQEEAAAAPEALPPIPTTWPGAFGLFKYSRDTVRFNLLTLVLLVIAYIASALVLSALLTAANAPNGISQIITNLVGAVFSIALMVTLLAGLRRTKLGVGESIKQTLSVYVKSILLYIALFMIGTVSLLLLIVPYFIVMPRLILSFYFLIDKKMGIKESIQASWDHTKGNVGKVWGIIGATIAMVLLMFTIIGIPFAIYFLIMYSGAYVVLYGYLIAQTPAQEAPVANQTPPVQQ